MCMELNLSSLRKKSKKQKRVRKKDNKTKMMLEDNSFVFYPPQVGTCNYKSIKRLNTNF